MKLKTFYFFVLITFLFLFKLNAQTVEPSSGINKKAIQFEIETLYAVEQASSTKTTSWNVPNVLVRYGLTNNIELQAHSPFTKERCFVDNQLTSNVFKFEEFEMGASINLWKQHKLIPEAALMARVILPTSSFKPNHVGNIVSLNFSHLVSNKFLLNYNIGTTTNLDKYTTGFYVVNVTYQKTPNLRFFIENNVGFTFDKTESNCLGIGFGVNVSNSFSIDYSIAKSLKSNMYYTGVIAAWVINTNKPSQFL